jgi:endonuclease G, mitochondrial
MARSRITRSPRLRLPVRWLLTLNLVAGLVLGGWFLLQPAPRQHEVRRLVEAALARDKNVSALDVAWDVWQLYYAHPASGRIAAGDKTHVYGGAPTVVAGADGVRLRVLVNRGYVVGYDDARASPAWVAYRVGDLPALPTPPPRPEKFNVDRRTVARVSPSAYTGSGYDRGHLAPNYAIATRYGAVAQEETFLMSNIAPQRHALNAGVWKELELKIATSYPARYQEVWVLTGPIFGPRPRELRGGVPIPDAFWLIVVDEHEGRLRTLSFIVPQDAPPSAALDRYVTSIDEIERRTHLDVLAELDDASEQQLEQQPAPRVW